MSGTQTDMFVSFPYVRITIAEYWVTINLYLVVWLATIYKLLSQFLLIAGHLAIIGSIPILITITLRSGTILHEICNRFYRLSTRILYFIFLGPQSSKTSSWRQRQRAAIDARSPCRRLAVNHLSWRVAASNLWGWTAGSGIRPQRWGPTYGQIDRWMINNFSRPC